MRVSVAGSLSAAGAERLAAELAESLRRRRERLVLDFERIVQAESEAFERVADRLREYAGRIRLVVPDTIDPGPLLTMFALEG